MDPGFLRLAAGVYDTYANPQVITKDQEQGGSDGRHATTSAKTSTPANPPTPPPPPPPEQTSETEAEGAAKSPGLFSLRQGLAYIALLMPSFATAQSFVAGNLSQVAPYGIPASDFAAALSTPFSMSTFSITGYNTSVSTSSGSTLRDAAADGWSLTVRLAANVPLAGAVDEGWDKGLCVNAAALTVTPPKGVERFNNTAWRVCAVVFTEGFKEDVAKDAVRDGSCSNVLPDECIRKLQANSVVGKTGRDGGGCQDLDVPEDCKRRLKGSGGTGFEITPVGNASLTGSRGVTFFASGFEPTQKGNRSALAAAQRRVWPVLLAWTHFNETGEVQDSAGWLSCAKTTEQNKVTGGGSAVDPNSPATQARWAFLVWAVAAAMMYF